jgi:hypothetical protein
MKAYIWWSIYIKTKNIAKLKSDHLHAIDEALEKIEFPWEISHADIDTGLFRIVNCQNLNDYSTHQVIISALRRAYKLAPTWSITGLSDLTTDTLNWVGGVCTDPPVKSRPPALASLSFEVQAGSVAGRSPEGGWAISPG